MLNVPSCSRICCVIHPLLVRRYVRAVWIDGKGGARHCPFWRHVADSAGMGVGGGTAFPCASLLPQWWSTSPRLSRGGRICGTLSVYISWGNIPGQDSTLGRGAVQTDLWPSDSFFFFSLHWVALLFIYDLITWLHFLFLYECVTSVMQHKILHFCFLPIVLWIWFFWQCLYLCFCAYI